MAGLPLSEETTDESFADQLASYDITNGSYSLNTDLVVRTFIGDPILTNSVWTEAVRKTFEDVKTDHPGAWRAVTQSNLPAHERTIRVWAAGNERYPYGTLGEDGNIIGFGENAISEHHVKLYYFPDFWGHEVIATALTANGSSIADYANYCGPLPSGWDAARDGRHYCIAAPGHTIDGTGQGTSFAAPRVAGVLAQMHVAARETMQGSHLVKRLMDTADNTGVFANSYVYGAGRMNAEPALSPQGALSYASVSGGRHSASTTSVTLPTAYGDAAASLAATMCSMSVSRVVAKHVPVYGPYTAPSSRTMSCSTDWG